MRRLVFGLMVVLLLTSMLMMMVNVQPVKGEWSGTVYIRADGSIEPFDAPIVTFDNITYTLTADITSSADGILIERDNIIIDGAGFMVQGSGAGYNNPINGIVLIERSNVTIVNVNLKNFFWGIKFYHTSNCNITANNITSNGYYGIALYEYCSNNSISRNYISNNLCGIYLYWSSGNNVFKNNVTYNTFGVELSGSCKNLISENIFVSGGLWVDGSFNNIVTDNLVNGKPLIYLEGASDMTVNDGGQVVLVNCYRIKVENLNITQTSVGVLLSYTVNSTITNNNLSANQIGVEIWESYGNTVFGNNITNNYEGVSVYRSFNNTVSRNNVKNNWWGIHIYYSSDNFLFDNNVIDNAWGIAFYSSSNNRLYHNNIVNNKLHQVSVDVANFWDNSYPSGGNYWSDYTGIDEKNGLNQDQPGSDGIGDTPYIINENNIDRYPLMAPFGGLTVTGQNITSYPSSDVCLIFENVISEGLTTVDMTNVGPEPPNGFKLAGNYYDIKTTANISGVIKLRIAYDDSGMTNEEEMNLRLMQWDEALQQWMDITTSLDTENNVIYGETSHLSIFALITPLYAPPTTYTLTITATTGGTTNPTPGTYTYIAGSSVQVTAIPSSGYVFDHWELNGTNVGSANPYTVIMDNNYNLNAFFALAPAPLTVSISPTSASILIGQSVTFTSTVSGGTTPYNYQWYLNDNPVSGATSDKWTFTPTTSGIFYIYLKVTDSKGNTAQSDVARLTVTTVPVGGYSIPINIETNTELTIPYVMLTTILTIALTTIKRKTTKNKQ